MRRPPGKLIRLLRNRVRERRQAAEQRRAAKATRRTPTPLTEHIAADIRQTKLVYFLVTGLLWLSTAVLTPLTVIFMQARGVDLAEVGFLIGLYSLTIVLLEIPTGGLADTLGRKRVTLVALSFKLVATVMFFFAFGFLAFLAAWVLVGVGRALISGAFNAWFVDRLQAVHPEINLQPPLAQAGSVELLALSGGTLLGGALPGLFNFLPEDGTAFLTPLAVPFVLSGLFLLGCLIATALLLKEVPLEDDNQGPKRLAAFPKLFKTAFGAIRKNRALQLLLAASFLAAPAATAVETFWQPRFVTLIPGESDNTFWLGVLMTGGFLAGMVGNLLSIPIARLLGKRHYLVAALGQMTQVLTLAFLALQDTALAAGGLFWLTYLTRGVASSPQEALLNEEISAAQRSTMLSAASLVNYAGIFIGSTLLGIVAERISIPVAWLVGSGVALLAVLVLLLLGRVANRGNSEVSS